MAKGHGLSDLGHLVIYRNHGLGLEPTNDLHTPVGLAIYNVFEFYAVCFVRFPRTTVNLGFGADDSFSRRIFVSLS